MSIGFIISSLLVTYSAMYLFGFTIMLLAYLGCNLFFTLLLSIPLTGIELVALFWYSWMLGIKIFGIDN